MKSLMPQIDSNDGLFHNGNPATGEQGTRVTDTWLNNLQDRVRDVQAEAHYVLQKAEFTPKAETQTQLYQAIVKIIDDNRKTASLTQKGEVQLSSSTNSNSETKAATSKAINIVYELANSKQSPATTLAGYGIGNFKVEEFRGDINTLKTDGVYAIRQASLSQNLPVSTSCHIKVIAGGDSSWCRQLAYVAYSSDVYERHQTSYQTDSWSEWLKINDTDSLGRSLSVDKSDAVNSSSSTTVATSRAVKTAYDKGVDAKAAADNARHTANNAQSAANAAQVTANDARHTANNAQSAANAANYNANGRI
ncbi:pyocin knob domain-containing protein, partial [Haemophilus influenzae]|uniref:pyocin knob domain-containing protein n=1 Tax=Haemophilus influenzae TaxID=727 RepID=UPI00211CA8CC